jgi:hypothetical protein
LSDSVVTFVVCKSIFFYNYSTLWLNQKQYSCQKLGCNSIKIGEKMF